MKAEAALVVVHVDKRCDPAGGRPYTHDFVGVDIVDSVKGLAVENDDRAEAALRFDVHFLPAFLDTPSPRRFES
jgi:hypothetical protein